MEKLTFGDTAELENGTEFICLSRLEANGEDYVYLMSNFKPLQIRFAKQKIENGELKLEIIENKIEKENVFKLFQDKINGLSNK